MGLRCVIDPVTRTVVSALAFVSCVLSIGAPFVVNSSSLSCIGSDRRQVRTGVEWNYK
jgi:hypothetical protein